MVMRLGGLATGMDTDTVVKQMLAREQAKIDKISGQKQILQWQQETYRDFAGVIKGFKSKYFDVLNKANYALSNDFFSSMTSKITGTDNGLLGIKVGNSAKPGRYEVNINKEAKGAVLQSKEGLTGKEPISGEIKIKTGDMEEAITIKGATTVKDLVSKINTDPGLKGKVKANFSEVSGKFTLETVGTGSSKFLEVSGTGDIISTLDLKTSGDFIKGSTLEKTYNEIITSSVIKLKDSEEVAKGENTLKEIGITGGSITIAGKKIDLDENTKIEDLVKDIQTKLDEYGKDKYSVGFSNGKISIMSNEPNESGTNRTGKIVVGEGDGSDVENLRKLGFVLNDAAFSQESNPIVTDTNYVIEVPDEIVKKGTAKININGKEVTVNFSNKTIEDSAGNILEGVNLELKDGKYKLTSKSDFNISGEDIKADGSSPSVTAGGQDAEIKVKVPGDAKEYTITNPKNSFTIDGITFDIKGETAADEKIVFNVESNIDKAVENVKGFVDAYNELIDAINSKTNERKQYKFIPLTEEQKKDMKEDDIKRWEEKCKQGNLRNDPALSKFVTDLRSSLFYEGGVDGVGISSLREIGIDTSSDYTQRGKLVINDEKLRKALTEKPDEVAQFFIKDNPKALYDSDKGYTGNEERKKSVGVFQRVSDIIEDAIRTTRNKKGQKGSLLEKAGIKGDTTDAKNSITDKIREKDDLLSDLARKMQEKETALYQKFAYLEKMTNFYNSQSSWLTQQLGGM